MNAIWLYIIEHPEQSLAALYCIAEFITRLTPTKKDDGFLTRAGKLIDQVLSRLPNRVK